MPLRLPTLPPHPRTTRSYAQITHLPPLPPPSKRAPTPYRHPAGPSRVFPAEKQFCWAAYDELLARSRVLILVSFDGISAAQLGKVRRELTRASPAVLPEGVWPPPPPPPAPPAPPESKTQLKKKKKLKLLAPPPPPRPPSPPPDPHPRATLHILRPGIFSALLRASHPRLTGIAPLLHGPIAAVSYPVLHPPVLAGLLRVLDRNAPRGQEAQDKGGKKRWRVLGGLVDWSKVLDENGLRETARLPAMDVLRGQIVGLVGGPAAQVAGVLGAASGGRAVGLLESWRRGREEAEGGGGEKEGETKE